MKDNEVKKSIFDVKWEWIRLLQCDVIYTNERIDPDPIPKRLNCYYIKGYVNCCPKILSKKFDNTFTYYGAVLTKHEISTVSDEKDLTLCELDIQYIGTQCTVDEYLESPNVKELRFRKTWGNLIGDIRKSRNLTQDEFGELIGVTDAAASKYEKGYLNPSVPTLRLMAHIFGINMNELLCWDENNFNKHRREFDTVIALEVFVIGSLPKSISDYRSEGEPGILLVKDECGQFSLPSKDQSECKWMSCQDIPEKILKEELVLDPPTRRRISLNIRMDLEPEELHLTRYYSNTKYRRTSEVYPIVQYTYAIVLPEQFNMDLCPDKEVICVPLNKIHEISQWCTPSIALREAIRVYFKQ